MAITNNAAPMSNMNSSNSNMNGFAPFTPRPHQPVTYTAGTFAQTKFGSTKLKTNGKKPNRYQCHRNFFFFFTDKEAHLSCSVCPWQSSPAYSNICN